MGDFGVMSASRTGAFLLTFVLCVGCKAGEEDGQGDEVMDSVGSVDTEESAGDGAQTESGSGSGSDSDSTSGTDSSSDDSSSDSGVTDSSGPEETGAGCEPGLTECLGDCVDLNSDDLNCGGCGVECKIVDGKGGCLDGACTPTWSDCVASEPLVACADVCASEGLACAPNECELATVFWFISADSCEGFDPAGGEPGPCTGPGNPTDPYYRCCCAQ